MSHQSIAVQICVLPAGQYFSHQSIAIQICVVPAGQYLSHQSIAIQICVVPAGQHLSLCMPVTGEIFTLPTAPPPNPCIVLNVSVFAGASATVYVRPGIPQVTMCPNLQAAVDSSMGCLLLVYW